MARTYPVHRHVRPYGSPKGYSYPFQSISYPHPEQNWSIHFAHSMVIPHRTPILLATGEV